MNDVEAAYEEANKLISAANAAYNKTIGQFKSTIKNDISSISSSANKVQNEAAKVIKACSDTSAMLTSPDFERAIQNAERLAAALQAISAVNSNKITFAVLGNNKEPT